MPAITADVDVLWQHLRESMARQSPSFDGILYKLPASSTVESFDATTVPPIRPTVVTRVRVQADEDGAPLDWVNGLGSDILSTILRFAGIAATGSAAASCQSLRKLALQDHIWRAFLHGIEPLVSATTLQQAQPRCREWCDLRRLEIWRAKVRAISPQAVPHADGMCTSIDGLSTLQRDAKVSFVQVKLDDAHRRLSSLQFEDYREAQRIRSPPFEFVLASTLLHTLLHEREGTHNEQVAVAWFQGLLPPIADKRGAQAHAHVGVFLSRFFDYASEHAPHRHLLQVEGMLPAVCLHRLDETIEKLVHDGYPKFGGGGCGPGKLLRATRVASAVIRWVAATVQGELTYRRARPLAEVGRELERACCIATQAAKFASLSVSTAA